MVRALDLTVSLGESSGWRTGIRIFCSIPTNCVLPNTHLFAHRHPITNYFRAKNCLRRFDYALGSAAQGSDFFSGENVCLSPGCHCLSFWTYIWPMKKNHLMPVGLGATARGCYCPEGCWLGPIFETLGSDSRY